MVDIKVKGPAVDTPRRETSNRTGGASGGTSQAQFGTAMKTARRQVLDGDLHQMLDQVRNFGDTFLKSPDEEKLGKYKDAISQYLERVSKETFSLRQEFGSMTDGQQKVYQLVDTVKHDIDGLTRETLQKDKALGLLGSLDDIRGLVLDLFT
ncbi:MAG TPA: YaaR family protein [Candidatus Ozemobacteraceae bacterium]|nr:YaaR family protein [Candidatus Ozemobacteraceae bacterium]